MITDFVDFELLIVDSQGALHLDLQLFCLFLSSG